MSFGLNRVELIGRLGADVIHQPSYLKIVRNFVPIMRFITMGYGGDEIRLAISCTESTLMQHGAWTASPAFFRRLMAAFGGACRRVRAARLEYGVQALSRLGQGVG